MAKRIILAVVLVFVAWEILDYVIHQVILSSAYEETAHLWRSPEEMNMVLLIIVALVVSFFFVYIYARLASPKTMTNAILYGFLFGCAYGISMAYGSYAVMPIPYSMALVWFLGTLVEMVVGGAITGLIIKEEKAVA